MEYEKKRLLSLWVTPNNVTLTPNSLVVIQTGWPTWALYIQCWKEMAKFWTLLNNISMRVFSLWTTLNNVTLAPSNLVVVRTDRTGWSTWASCISYSIVMIWLVQCIQIFQSTRTEKKIISKRMCSLWTTLNNVTLALSNLRVIWTGWPASKVVILFDWHRTYNTAIMGIRK